MKNCSFSTSNVVATEDISETSLAVLKGNTTDTRTMHIRASLFKVPPKIISKYIDVILVVDVMFINELCYFITKFCHINFTSGKFITNGKIETLMNNVTQVQKILPCTRIQSVHHPHKQTILML